MSSLQTTFCGVEFANPLVLASGIWGVTGNNLAKAIHNGAGGVTTKSLWLDRHTGHPNPTIIANDFAMLNAVGLADGGIDKAHDEVADYRNHADAPLIASIVAGSPDDFAAIAHRVVELRPDLIEVNISCPNVKDEFGDLFGSSMLAAETFTKIVKAETKNIPLSIKLSPNIEKIGEIAAAAEAAGADAITAINTVGPGMRIDTDMRCPILANKVGGVSGPAILPIAMAKVFEIYKAVTIPVIATGGITTGSDAIEMLMAGGSLLGVGSAVHYNGFDCFQKIADEMQQWCDEQGVKNIEEIIGAAHRG